MGSSFSDISKISEDQKIMHQSIKELVPDYKSGDEDYDRFVLTEYCYGTVGTHWKDHYNKNNFYQLKDKCPGAVLNGKYDKK